MFPILNPPPSSLPIPSLWVVPAIFLFEFKMVCKAMQTACNINYTFDPRSANEHTVRWWFKKFCKGDESLDNEEHSGWPLEVDNDS